MNILASVSQLTNNFTNFVNYFQSQHYSLFVLNVLSDYLNSHNWQWGGSLFIIMATYLFLKKMGSEFLKDVQQLPLLLNIQKKLFCFLQFIVACIFLAVLISIVMLGTASFLLLKKWSVLWLMLDVSAYGLFIGIGSGYIAGKLLQQSIAKKIEPKYSKLIQTRKNQNIEEPSDVRKVAALIDDTHDYDPIEYFKEGHIFIGLDEKKSPIYMLLADFVKVHVQIMGCTGSGKSVAAINILAQSLQQGVSAVMFDPKVGADEWAPHVLRTMCEKYGKKFIIIDLERLEPQINIIENITEKDLNELLQAGMGIEDKGGDGDYYRLKDRKAARIAATLAGRATSFSHLYTLMLNEYPEHMEAADSFCDKLEMLATIAAVKTAHGVDIRDAVDNGHCLYIVGAMRDPQVKMLQKMVLLRLMQIIENRDRLIVHRHIVLFIDELKYFLTRPVLDALSTVRDHQCNLLLGHQGPGDLLDVSRDISGQACQNTVVTNTNVKLLYKLNDDLDQRKAASLTGEKSVMRQSMRQRTNMGVGEVTDTDERQLMSVQEPLYSHNYFAQLKPRVGIIIGLGLAKLCFTSPIIVEKKPLIFPVFDEEPDYIRELAAEGDISQMSKPDSKQPPVSTIKNDTAISAVLMPNIDQFDELHLMEALDSDHHNLEDIQ